MESTLPEWLQKLIAIAVILGLIAGVYFYIAPRDADRIRQVEDEAEVQRQREARRTSAMMEQKLLEHP